jgi:3-methyladenine DNA glycosylase AlkC
MSAHRKTKKQFLLKDLLFNEAKVKKLALELKSAYPSFDDRGFVKKVVSAFPELELMERIHHIKESLREYLPTDYEESIKIIVSALPPPLDNSKTDDDFGEFIYAPYSYFVAEYGCEKNFLKVSLVALEEITKRFSAEAALRPFINKFPKEILACVTRWSESNEYHVRRLASEGTRPNLPWAKKINYDHQLFLPILDTLHADKTRYVTRSVANHLNDVSKFAPSEVMNLLEKWRSEGKQSQSELSYITKHSLRTLVKEGDERALKILGYNKIRAVAFLRLDKTKIKVGDELKFDLEVEADEIKPSDLLIHYIIYFKKSDGRLSPKVFLLKKTRVNKKEKISISKKHSLKPMTTRVLYSGEHKLEIRINGQKVAEAKFDLI